MSEHQGQEQGGARRWDDRLIDRLFVPRSQQGWKHWLGSGVSAGCWCCSSCSSC